MATAVLLLFLADSLSAGELTSSLKGGRDVADESVRAGELTNSWAVQVLAGGEVAADALASKYGFINLGLVGGMENVYHFKMSSSSANDGENELKRGSHSEISTTTQQLQENDNVGFAMQQEKRRLYKKGYIVPNDQYWKNQWSLRNKGLLNSTDVGRDINVEGVWLQGVTGCGSTVAIVDDGVEYTHYDLRKNYLKSFQYDFLKRKPDAMPDTKKWRREKHGTNSAGVVGMRKGNRKCGVGVAYNSLITGLRLVSNTGSVVTDLLEAVALSWHNNQIDIYNCGWGPKDDGVSVSGPGYVLSLAMSLSIKKGRDGKGSIYVFAAGNGGSGDTCAADGYTNSIYTISVGSAGSDGRQSSFDESCSGKMVVTFDSDPYKSTKNVLTTSVFHSCTSKFEGTSTSTALTSGAIALLLERNPDLTWRDVQYLLAYTSNRNNLLYGNWVTNGAGLKVSHKFGFGALDTEALVSRGRHWINVPDQVKDVFVPPFEPSPHLKMSESYVKLSWVIQGGQNVSASFKIDSAVRSLEHVVVFFNMYFITSASKAAGCCYMEKAGPERRGQQPQRGTVQLSLTSPSGTTSTLLPLRPKDVYPGSYQDWPLMSVHFWGEKPDGVWTVAVAYTGTVGKVKVQISNLTLYGTSRVPEAVSRIPEQCSNICDSTRGCADMGAEFCDACAKFRVASTLECVSTCPRGLSQRNRYCYDSNQGESRCDATPTNSTTPSTTSNTPTSTPSSSDTPTSTTDKPPSSSSDIVTSTATPTTPPSDHTPGKRSDAMTSAKWCNLSAVILLAVTAISVTI